MKGGEVSRDFNVFFLKKCFFKKHILNDSLACFVHNVGIML